MNINSILNGIYNVEGLHLVSCWHGHRRLGLKSRFVAALAAIASVVACGGGGGSIPQRAQVQAAVQLSSTTLAFGNQHLNVASAAQTVTVTNGSSLAVAFTAVSVAGENAGDFAKTADTCFGVSLSPQGTCTVSVTFTPSALGSRTAALNFTDTTSNSPQTVSLSGTGVGPVVSFSAPDLTLQTEPAGTTSPAQTETVTNSGTENLAIATVTVVGTNAGDFAKTADTCTGSTVAPNSS